MLIKELGVCHGSMTAPAEEGDVRPEPDISCPVPCRVRLYGMAHETDRLTVHVHDIAIGIQHDMSIDLCVLILRMTLKADLSPVRIGASPQEFWAPFFMVRSVAGQTSDLSVIEREGEPLRIGGSNIDRVVVLPVLMTVKALQ
jgi:hypothetical protein